MNASDSRFFQLSKVEQRALNELVTRLEDKLTDNLVAVRLFGSRARGTGDADSDLDVLVVLERDDLVVRRMVRHLAADVWLAHGTFISTRVWSRERMQRMEREPTLLGRNIQRDAINLLHR